MSRIFLVPPSPVQGSSFDHLMADYDLVQRAATRGAPGPHELANSPAESDVVLFVGSRDPLHRDVRRHPIARQHSYKVVLYDSSDWIIPFLPGIYPSIQKRDYRAGRIWSGFYLRYSDSEAIRFTEPEREAKLLFGFVGSSATHPVRKRVLALSRVDALMRDTDHEPGAGFNQPRHVYQEYRETYARDLASVLFVLCPRGVGPGSMRVFEAMKAGRVPVIISDQWVEPEGPDWTGFSLRVPERDVESIPDLLDGEAARAPDMGRAARVAWERWFSPLVAFQSMAQKATEISCRSNASEWLARKTANLSALRWHSLRHYIAGPVVRRLIAAIRSGS